MKKKLFKMIAHTLLLSFGYQLIFPAYAYALTTGPSQPEVQSFEPVGTTEMVDMFSGDFNYNIPLMDVEGYPINIFYHSGVGMEQEASWVGLGWNINPGEINRNVRGIPDDFNGETIEKYTKIKEEKDIRIGIGANLAAEIFGKGLGISMNQGLYVNHNNYRGISAGITTSVGIKTPAVSFGVNIGLGSQTGADIDLSASANLSQSHFEDGAMGKSVGAGLGGGYNSRSGLKDFSFDVSVKKNFQSRHANTHQFGVGTGTTIPVGLQNYVPVIANQVVQNAYALQLKAGPEIVGGFPSVYVDAMISSIKYDPNGSRPAYGYLYAENAGKESIMDFSRDKDGVYNTTMQNLPMSANTYDIYSVNGQGTGGMFRPFRNDIGTVYDPYVDPAAESDNYSAMLEVGLGNLFEGGADLSTVRTRNECGPWTMLKYGGDKPGTLYEKFFFKNGGDVSYNQQQEAAQIYNNKPTYLLPDLQNLVAKGKASAGSMPQKLDGTMIYWNNSVIDRSARSSHIAYQTAEQAQLMPELDAFKQVTSYENGAAGKFYDPALVKYNRYGSGANHNAKGHQLSEFTQTLQDGKRYVYGIPAMNNVSREVTFAIDEARANWGNGTVGFNSGVDDGPGNTKGLDNLYATSNTPAYAHSYLLTGVLSNDYVDILGDGPTDDDLGNFTKINYTLTDKDYRWRTPYHKDSAQLSPGYRSDTKDGKGNFIAGSRQQWYVRSIESKNYIAEFYTSKRKDGLGIKDPVLQSGSSINSALINFTTNKSDSSFSYKLDSVVLYNKHDRYINKENAVPVKTVVLQYDYSLCQNTPNSIDAAKGKLTLKKLFVKYGNSHKNLLSPYVFDYKNENPAYNFAAKDRWGNYKEVVPGTNNYDFPYCLQPEEVDVAANNKKLAAWNLTDIKLPSGGKIHMDYESDDYAFVQDRRAMQMLKIEGVGSGTAYERKSILYSDENNINDYIYFKRRKDKERSGVSMKDNYLENQELVYYSFDLDVTGKGNYEYIKGFAKFEDIGVCSDNTDYGYIRLQRENVKGMKLHPAVVLGINTARYYLPHLFYDGYQENSDVAKVVKGLFGSGIELVNTLVLQNPFKRFINQKKSKSINIANSSIRLQEPSLSRKGGGLRVQQLTLSDSWNSLAGGQDAVYGKKYDYTMPDPGNRYGTISSGVASYEPMVGADENPFRLPVPYAADKGRLLPAIEFFQLEPFGESFYPGASVGYSSVKVTSIHQDHGRSAQAMDEYQFYTAKDYPIKMDYTSIDGQKDAVSRSLTDYYKESEVMQGYALVLNDMHGKPKAVNNYTRQEDGGVESFKLITGVKYNYRTDAAGKSLDNNVDVLMRKRGTVNTYELRKAKLGEDVDISIDSRQRRTDVKMTATQLNLNVFVWGIFPMFTFTAFHSRKSKTIGFKSMVTSKIIQQYGMIRSIEQLDHDAKTTTENLVYDGESGSVLLSKTSNQYNDNIYSRRDPAHWAYEGMMPAYTNTSYEETVDSLVVDENRDGFLYTKNKDRFSPGDELLVNVHTSAGNPYMKLWVTESARETIKSTAVESSPNVLIYTPRNYFYEASDIGMSASYHANLCGSVNVKIKSGSTVVKTGSYASAYDNFSTSDIPSCKSLECLKLTLAPGVYDYEITGSWAGAVAYTGSLLVSAGKSTVLEALLCFSGEHIPTGSGDVVGVVTHSNIPPCYIKSTTPDMSKPCALGVAPRYRDLILTGPHGSVNRSNWPLERKKFLGVTVKVIRSGRRNMLDKSVQELQVAAPAGTAPFFTDLNSYMNKTSSVINSSVTTYTDNAQNYKPFTNNADLASIGNYVTLNDFVLGLRGNFRPLSTYAPIAKRAYDKGHERYDGTYSIDQVFWSFVNAYAGPAGSCAIPRNILVMNNLSGTLFWKKAATITRYDPQGNALEEQDALGNYSSAQYGYNNFLPVAVASNAQAQQIMFDGFEDYTMLLPQISNALYKNGNRQSNFAKSFGTPVASVLTDYPSEEWNSDASVFIRHGQRYQLTEKVAGVGTITNEASHTGFNSLKFLTAKSVYFGIADNVPGSIAPFMFAQGKKFKIKFWVKAVNPSSPVPFSAIKITTNVTAPMTQVTNAIDGWYLMEGVADFTSVAGMSGLTLSMPANIYMDDIRILPVKANMKCFVYDPLSFRLMAQLDESHFATFFEYDQEGLLIRTKKETAKGIMTISESRRANTKPTP